MVTVYKIWRSDTDHGSQQEAIEALADETGIDSEAVAETLRKNRALVDDEGTEWKIEEEEV